jgi:transcriptional regulator with PAS, ATPase and Fis domain
VRVIAATHRVPTEAIAQGQLRQDLFYRLNVFLIRVPPLRERRDDILRLVQTFIEEFNRQENRQVRHSWPTTSASSA